MGSECSGGCPATRPIASFFLRYDFHFNKMRLMLAVFVMQDYCEVWGPWMQHLTTELSKTGFC